MKILTHFTRLSVVSSLLIFHIILASLHLTSYRLVFFACYNFWRRLSVCASNCPHKISKTTEQKLMWLGRKCPMVNPRSGWKLVISDLDPDLWPRRYLTLILTFDPGELFSYYFNSCYIFWMALPCNFIFSLEIHLENIWITLEFQGQGHGSMQLKNYRSEIAGTWLEYVLL